MMNSSTAPLFLQLRYLVIEPTLAYLGLSDPAATNLLLGTAAQESGFRFLAQYPTGPARGIYQIEPATHHDLLDNFVKFHPDLAARLSELVFAACDRDQQLTVNLSYATAIARLLYLRAPGPMPKPTDIPGLAAYWKQHYNTPLGAGQPEEFVANFQRYIGEPSDA
jgi:hypothetical protein